MKRRRMALWGIDVMGILGAIMAVPVTNWMLENGKPCFSLQKGIICPACGGTHCVNNFFQGNIIVAFRYNPMVVCGMFYIFLVGLIMNLELVWNHSVPKRVKEIMIHPVILTLLCVIYVAVGFMRNF